jgi:nitrate reductase NapAB chaperone NapD
MPVTSAVVTAREGATESLIRRLRNRDGVTAGLPSGPRIPVVVESDDRRGDRETWDALANDPDVAFVDFVFSSFEDALPVEVADDARSS